MNYRIVLDDSFEREVKRLSKRYASLKADLANLCQQLYANPHLGTDLGGGLRKIRMAITSKGRGKSGGARVITFTVVVAVWKKQKSTCCISMTKQSVLPSAGRR